MTQTQTTTTQTAASGRKLLNQRPPQALRRSQGRRRRRPVRPGGRVRQRHRPQRRRQDHVVRTWYRVLRSGSRKHPVRWAAHRGPKPNQITTAGISRTFQSVRLFGNMTVLENVMVWPALSHQGRRSGPISASAARSRKEGRSAEIPRVLSFFGDRFPREYPDEPRPASRTQTGAILGPTRYGHRPPPAAVGQANRRDQPGRDRRSHSNSSAASARNAV